MNKHLQVIEELERLLFRKKLTKSEVCRTAGLQNSLFSRIIERARAGKVPSPEHIEKIRAAIESLPDRSKTNTKEKAS